MTSTRKLRITSRWRRVQLGPGTSVPEIRLVGKWLGRVGFHTGAAVHVDVQDKQITIRLA